MREAELNRQRVVFTPQEAARLPQDRPYAAYICHYDWAEGEHATLMHCHERLAEVLLILKGSGRYTVDLRRYEVAAGDVVLCSGGALHDEVPQADQPYQTRCVAIGNLALADLPETAAEADSGAAELWDAVARLPEKLRVPIHLYYAEGYSTEEIAGLLDIPAATVRTRLRRARKRLKDLLGGDDHKDLLGGDDHEEERLSEFDGAYPAPRRAE